MALSNSLVGFIENSKVPILIRALAAGLIQFSIAGLGSLVVCIIRKDTFSRMGLRKNGALKSIVGAVIFFIPYLLYLLISGQLDEYMPLSVLITDDILCSSIFNRILGMAIVGVFWGFFEGFNYSIVSRVINQRYPSKINIGAITCSFICIYFTLLVRHFGR